MQEVELDQKRRPPTGKFLPVRVSSTVWRMVCGDGATQMLVLEDTLALTTPTVSGSVYAKERFENSGAVHPIPTIRSVYRYSIVGFFFGYRCSIEVLPMQQI